MNNINYDKQMLEIIKCLKSNEKLLLHSCCAPCSTSCIERLNNLIDLTVYYYNPNIDTEQEFLHRREEQIKYCKKQNVKAIVEDYLQKDYLSAVIGFENELEGGKRCEKCFYLRLKKTAEKAKELGFNYIATTLTVSPLKNAKIINQIGFEIEKETGVKYLPTDFKKQGGYLRSIELSKQNNMYRQNYCGCIFSKPKDEK